jgi:hypothetical protein
MTFDYETLHAEITALRNKQLFFVGGAPKSGTTWLQILLDQHPTISCSGEGHFPTALIPRLLGAASDYNRHIAWKNETVFNEISGYPQLAQKHIAYIVASAIALQLSAQLEDPTIQMIGEKTPDNVRYFPMLQGAFPKAKFVQIVRDGRDCAVSGWFHNLRATPEWTRETFASIDAYVDTFAQEWAENVSAGSRFGAARPNSYLAIRYEDLVQDPAPVLARLLEFLGAPADQKTVSACIAAGSFRKLSGGRAPGEENRGSFFRKGLPGDWRNHLTSRAKNAFEDKAGEWLTQFGYAA